MFKKFIISIPLTAVTVILSLALLLAWTESPLAQQRRGGQSNTKFGLNRTMVSGAIYTLEKDDGTSTSTNSDAIQGNDLVYEYIIFGRLGLEFAVGLTEMTRNYKLESGGATITNVEESARPVLFGMNLYFSDHASNGFKYYFGIGAGQVTVNHTFTGGTLGAKSSSQTIPLNTMKLGMDWIEDHAGVRFQVISQTGSVIDTTTFATETYTQTIDYTATVVVIGVFALF